MINYKLALISFFLIMTQLCYGQKTKALVHLNQPFYVTGETVWYKINLPNGLEEFNGKVKVIVKSSQDEVIGDYFTNLANKTISGYFKIPFDKTSDLYNVGMYVLELDTKTMIQLLSFDIPIYNDLSAEKFTSIIPNNDYRSQKEISTNDDLSLNIETDKADYNLGEEVQIMGEVSSSNGNPISCTYSVSVIDQDLFGSNIQNQCVFTVELNLQFNTKLDLNDNLFLKGTIVDGQSNAPLAVNIIGAYSHAHNTMHLGKSGTDGKFTIMIPETTGDQQIQIVGNLFDEYDDTRVELFTGNEVSRSNVSFTSEFDSIVQSYVELSKHRKRIYQQFKTVETDVDFPQIHNVTERVVPNKTFIMSEYVDFETVGAFFDEIISAQLSFEKVGDIYKAKMFDPTKNKGISARQDFYFKLNPVFIVDGQMTKNADFIYKLSLNQFEEIDLYFDKGDIRKQYGLFGDFGYVILRSKNGDLSVPKEDVDDILNYQAFLMSPIYPVAIDGNTMDRPKLHPSVYWHPEIIAKSGKINTSFTSSDDVSSYLVQVVARTDQGDVLVKHLRYNTKFTN